MDTKDPLSPANRAIYERVWELAANQPRQPMAFMRCLNAAMEEARAEGRMAGADAMAQAFANALTNPAEGRPERWPSVCGTCGQTIMRDRMLGTRCGCSPPATIAGMTVHRSELVPQDQVVFRSSLDGRELGRIVNIGPPTGDEEG